MWGGFFYYYYYYHVLIYCKLTPGGNYGQVFCIIFDIEPKVETESHEGFDICKAQSNNGLFLQ